MTRIPLRSAVVSEWKFALRQGLFWSAVLLCGVMGFLGVPVRAQTFTPPANIAGDTTAFSPQVIVDSTGNLDIAYLDTGSAVSSNALSCLIHES
jgi:hypothetical protein